MNRTKKKTRAEKSRDTDLLIGQQNLVHTVILVSLSYSFSCEGLAHPVPIGSRTALRLQLILLYKKNIIPKISLSVYFCKVQYTHNSQYLYTHSVALEGCEPYNDDLKGCTLTVVNKKIIFTSFRTFCLQCPSVFPRPEWFCILCSVQSM